MLYLARLYPWVALNATFNNKQTLNLASNFQIQVHKIENFNSKGIVTQWRMIIYLSCSNYFSQYFYTLIISPLG